MHVEIYMRYRRYVEMYTYIRMYVKMYEMFNVCRDVLDIQCRNTKM
jgi:hypothetical protein